MCRSVIFWGISCIFHPTRLFRPTQLLIWMNFPPYTIIPHCTAIRHYIVVIYKKKSPFLPSSLPPSLPVLSSLSNISLLVACRDVYTFTCHLHADTFALICKGWGKQKQVGSQVRGSVLGADLFDIPARLLTVSPDSIILFLHRMCIAWLVVLYFATLDDLH